jgi:lysophospholipase L1-like esterase
MMNLRYYLGALISIPLLPILYYQGIQIRKKVPKLPEATGTEGECVVTTKAENPLQIISLGESTVAGVGVQTHEDGFTGSFASELSTQINRTIQWKVYAKSGYTAKQVRELLGPNIQEKNPDLIIVGLGGNDAFTLNHPKRWRKHIQQLIIDLRHQFPESFIVFTNMPPIKEFPAFTPLIKFVMGNLVEILGHEVKGLVKNYDRVIYFDDKITLKEWQERLNIAGQPSDFFSDGVHPSKLTYQTWAKDLAQRIAKMNPFD